MAQGRTYHREKAMRIFNISLIMNKLFDNIKNKVSDFVKMDFAVMELEGMEFHAFHGCLESERLRTKFPAEKGFRPENCLPSPASGKRRRNDHNARR